VERNDRLLNRVELFRISAQRNPVAVLWYEPRRPRGISLIAGHGYSSSKQNLDFLCSFLATHGFGVYNLDFPGHKLGASGGELRGVDDCLDAMTAVVEFARERGDSSSYTLGHSMGGMTAIFTAALDEKILGTVAIATGYGRPTSLAALRKIGATDFRSSYVVGVTLPELVAGVDQRYAQLLGRLAGRQALYVAAQRDGMVSPQSVRELYEHAPESKTFATIDSDHTYAAERARATVLEWLNQRHPSGQRSA
jgi:alpha-beta hydrolase superfamily lysophospholipase